MQYRRTTGITSILVLVVSYLFLSGCVKTENAINPESLKTWEIYNTENGLGSDSVWTLFEDKESNIWVGTENNGVSKFDGKIWTIYNVASGLIDNSVVSITQDGYGYMWFGTLGGLSILANNEWTNIADFGGIYALLKDHEDNMWLCTDNYPVLEYKNNQWYQYHDDECEWCNIVNVLFEDNEKNIWLGSEQDLKKLTGQTMTSYNQSDGLPGGGITSLHQDIWGNIWIASWGSPNVIKYHNGNFESVSLSTGLSIEFVTSIASDNNGNVWFGLKYMGAIKYNGSVMERYSDKDGLPYESVTKILKDKHGYLWFGTLNGGVAKYLPGLN
jgi:two-component system sensor histidine kinase ChiS